MISRFTEFITDWRYLIKQEGLQAALPVVTREIIQLPYRQLEFVVLTCPLDQIPDLHPKIDLEIRDFIATDLVAVQQMSRPSEANLCAKRLNLGHIGLLAAHKDQPVGYAWACSQLDPELERVQIHLDHGAALCVDVFTAPAFRRRGIHTALTLARFRKLRELGYKEAVAYIEISNYPSLAVWRKIGGQVESRIRFRRIGSWRKTDYL